MVSTLKVIPVIDILGGVAVHAVRGRRSQYKPLESTLTKSTEPKEIAHVFEALGFTDLYLADLDAIIDCSTNFQFLKEIAKTTHLRLWVDAGVNSIERAEKLLASGVTKIVVGTETLESKKFVELAVKQFGSDHVVVSLDLKGDQVLFRSSLNDHDSPICLLKEFKKMGISQVIVLDLLRVGSGEGPNAVLLKKILAEVELDVYLGGGVRDIKDLAELKNLGVSGALIATALHNGKITVDELEKEAFI